LKYYISGQKDFVDKNNGLPPNLPSAISLVYQLRKDYSRFLPEQKHKPRLTPLTTFYSNKHLNGRKLSSHLWFFEGFCKLINPKYITLVDVGTLVL
jgi:chitin synthase